MRMRQLMRLGALCAAALMLCSCDFLGFDGDIEPDGWECSLKTVTSNNLMQILFWETDDYFLPEGCEARQEIRLAGVKELEPPLYPDDSDAWNAKEYVETFKSQTLYFEPPENGEGYKDPSGAVYALLYPDYDSYADKVSLNELILRNGWGEYEESPLLSWSENDRFEDAESEAREAGRGIWSR